MSFVDSICVKFINSNLIVYGKGNQLILRHVEESKFDKLKPCRDKVHRISYLKCDNNTYKIACIAGRELVITEIRENSFRHDFVINTKFSDWIMDLCYLKDKSIAIITAHNVALLLTVNGNHLTIKQKLMCHDNSTLYCSHMYGDCWENLIFFSGTALGQLIIWKGTHSNDDNVAKQEIIYQNSHHNGVIFTINYYKNSYESYLISGSDDRSIKIFKTNKNLTELYEQKQLFGHTSRVFVSRIICYKNSIKFVSAGEDGSVNVWNEDGSLQIKKTVVASGGIWNLDYDEKSRTIITSTATGKLNIFQLDRILFEEHLIEEISIFKDIHPIKLVYLKNGSLCVLDSNMQLFIKIDSQWIFITQLIHKIVVMASFENNNRLVLLAKNSIITFDFSNCDSNNLNYSTADLNIIEKFSFPKKIDFYLRAIHTLKKEIFVSDMHGYCFVINIEDEKLLNLFRLPKSSTWTTVAAKYGEFWIVGDRAGSLLLYRDNNDLSIFHKPIFKMSKLISEFGITNLKFLGHNFFTAAGIGGIVKTLFLNEKMESIEIYKTEKTPINCVKTMRCYNNIEYTFGFNDNYFVISKSKEVIYEHRCGGKYRNWDVMLVNNDDCSKLRFTYINKKRIHSVQFYINDFIFDSICNHDDVFWHLKGSNVIKMIDDDALILISGGEDTFLKLTMVEQSKVDNDLSFKSIADINSHISSIKALDSFSRGNDIMIISVGGRAQIVLTRLIKMKYVKEEINLMLMEHLNLNNISKEENEKKINYSFDPETRFTCVHFDEKSNNIFVGCSDGFIRVFKLIENEYSLSLKLIIESFYGRCILKLTIIKDFVLSMATDGIICFWYFNEIECNMKIIDKLQHNRNGINCYDVFTNDYSYKIATAGDDAGIYVTEFEILNDCLKFNTTIKSYKVHNAQVTGIKFLSPYEILSVGIDQMVCKIKIGISDEFEIVDKKFTCISDVKGFALFRKTFILIHGAGLEKLDYF